MSSTGQWRFELSVIPSVEVATLDGLFDAMVRLPLQGVSWLGWRAEPFLFGAEKLVAVVILDESVHCDSSMALEAVLTEVRGTESVQGCDLHGEMKEYIGDAFSVSSKLFSVDPKLSSLSGLQQLTSGAMRQLLTEGFVIVDNWMRDVSCDVSRLVNDSLGEPGRRGADGIRWVRKEPQGARGDVATDLEEGQRPATDSVFADQLLPAFEQLHQDLWTCIGMRGEQQQQLAWYPGDGTGYSAHYDSWPVEEADSSIRKVTAILYCNPEWQPEHGGTLKAWLPDHVGARVLEVEPTAGRLVVFLSGIVKHEVSPAYQPRVAFTNWFI